MHDLLVDAVGRNLRRRVNGRLAVDKMSVVARQSILAKSRFLGAPVTEFVPVIVARVIYFAVRFDVGIKSHRPVEAGEARFDGRRSGILRGRTIAIELYIT